MKIFFMYTIKTLYTPVKTKTERGPESIFGLRPNVQIFIYGYMLFQKIGCFF